jgi:uncharacterized protein YcbK (DUF882 family)
MLPKPVTAFALSALVSIASLTASSAVAATNPSADVSATATSSQMKGAHHVKGKRATLHTKKSHLPPLHSAEPKESPKLAASLTTHLDVKPASAKAEHASASRKTTLAATGKEIYIGGPTKAGATAKADTLDKLDRSPVDSNVPTRSTGKASTSLRTGKGGPMAKAGRAPARTGHAVAKPDSSDSASDDHPVPVALRTGAKPAAKSTAPCLHAPIEFVRGAETDSFSVTRCDGTGAPLAAERLSVLVRTENAERPASVSELAKIPGHQLAPGIRRVDPGMLERLQKIADHFAKPGMSERVAIVSGYRPGSTGSYHASGQALDFHLEGVPNEAVVDFCKTLDNTGCGYYPNSSFVHVDVRAPGAGHIAWIDTSGPGEPPHYVSSWPPPPEPDVKIAKKDDNLVNPDPEALPQLPTDSRGPDELKAPAASMTKPLNLKDWE